MAINLLNFKKLYNNNVFNYAVAAPVRVYAAGLYKCVYVTGKPYRAG